MRREEKGKRKPPRGGHRAGMRRDIFWDRIKLALIVILGGATAAALIYINFD